MVTAGTPRGCPQLGVLWF